MVYNMRGRLVPGGRVYASDCYCISGRMGKIFTERNLKSARWSMPCAAVSPMELSPDTKGKRNGGMMGYVCQSVPSDHIMNIAINEKIICVRPKFLIGKTI